MQSISEMPVCQFVEKINRHTQKTTTTATTTNKSVHNLFQLNTQMAMLAEMHAESEAAVATLTHIRPRNNAQQHGSALLSFAMPCIYFCVDLRKFC